MKPLFFTLTFYIFFFANALYIILNKCNYSFGIISEVANYFILFNLNFIFLFSLNLFVLENY